VLNTRSFSDILIDQILEDYDLKPSSVASNTLNAGWESTLDPRGMAQILAQTETHTFAKANRHNPYRFKAKNQGPAKIAKDSIKTQASSAVSNIYVSMEPSSQRPPHSMSDEQLKAYSLIKQFVAQLPDNFDLTQLKTAYRRSVLQAHPDHGGTSETFQNVKKSYQILTALVK
jgi:phosphoglucomutase